MEKHLQKRVGKVIPFIQDGTYFFNKGVACYRRRDLRKAKAYLQRAVQLEPEQSTFACQLAIVLSELGEYTQSNEWLLRIIEHNDDLTECFYFLANNYAHLGLFGEATKYAEQYMEREPDGEFAEYTLDLLDILTIEQDDNEWFNYDDMLMKQEQARALLEKGEFQEAIALFEEMIEQHPENWAAYNNLALAYFYEGNVPKARQTIEYILKQNPGNLHALCNDAVFSYYLQEQERLFSLIQSLQNVYPISFEHRYKLGVTFAIVGRYDLAFQWLRQLQRRGFEGDAPFYYWYAYTAYHMGYRMLAESMWNKFILLHPDKKGSEPWRYREQTIEHIQSLFAKQDVASSLYALYLISKSFTLNDCPFPKQSWSHPLLQQWSEYVYGDEKQVPTYIVDAHCIVTLLIQHNGFEYEPLYIAWFSFFVKAIKEIDSLSNHEGWAAAFEYMFRRQRGQRVTQRMLAERYGVSVATVGKYVKIIKQQWHE
ncbi:tetratricopeptide repeat protein [Anoxybacillus sp. TBDG-1]